MIFVEDKKRKIMKTNWSVTESVTAFREMIAGKARWDEQMRNNNIVRNMRA